MIGICGRLEGNRIMQGEIVTWLVALLMKARSDNTLHGEAFVGPNVQLTNKSNTIVLLYGKSLEESRIPPDFFRAKCRRLLALKSPKLAILC